MKITGSEYRVDGTAAHRVEFPDRRQAAAFEAAASGACWVRGGLDPKGGLTLLRHDAYPSPGLETDPAVAPHFPPGKAEVQTCFVGPDETPELAARYEDVPVYARHLCGYGYTPENYRRAAAWMESAGFACLRSRRGPGGKFWEVWYLPGVWAAKGPIEGFKTHRAVCEAVCRNARPGAVTAGAPGGWFQTVD